MQPTRPAPMSGGWQSRPKNVGWCGPERSDYTARVFCPKGLALTAWGPQAPLQSTRVVQNSLSVQAKTQPSCRRDILATSRTRPQAKHEENSQAHN
jgi:hypothetical protein